MAAPQSLKAGTTAALRRLIAAATSDTAAPTTSSSGFASGWRYVNVMAKATGGTSFNVTVWQWSAVAEKWAMRTDIGTAGKVPVVTAENGGVAMVMLDVRNADRIAVQAVDFVGGASAEVWGEGLRVND